MARYLAAFDQVRASRGGEFARAWHLYLAALAGHGVAVSGRDIAIIDRAELQRLARPHRLIDESAR